VITVTLDEKTDEVLEERGLVRKVTDAVKPEYVTAYELLKSVPHAVKTGLRKRYDNSWQGVKELYRDSKKVINYGVGAIAGSIYGFHAGFMHFCGRSTEQIMNESATTAFLDSTQIFLSRVAMSMFIGGALVKLIQHVGTTRKDRNILTEVCSVTSSYVVGTSLWIPALYGVLSAQGSQGIPETLGGEALSMALDIPLIIYFTRNRMNMNTGREI
jgi:hypothetical protein